MDARLIVQVIVNVVNNAVKYTPPGSEIVIRVQRQEDFIKFEIADNGNGIPDEAKPHVFDMFYTANTAVTDSRRGVGLGLALCTEEPFPCATMFHMARYSRSRFQWSVLKRRINQNKPYPADNYVRRVRF